MVANLTTNRRPRPLKIWISEVSFLKEVKVFSKTSSIMILKSTEKTYPFFLYFLRDTKGWAEIWERIKNKKNRTENIFKVISSGKVFLFESKWILSFEAFQISQRLFEDKYLTDCSFIEKKSFLTQGIWMILYKINKWFLLFC